MKNSLRTIAQTATNLADCLVKGHHYASVHLVHLIEADTNRALHPFAATLGTQIQAYLKETDNPIKSEKRLAQLDTALYELMPRAAGDWVQPGHLETNAQPQTITCQAVRVNGQTCNAPVAEGSHFCRYHLNHESDR